MFTGIIEELGKMSSLKRNNHSLEIEIEAKLVLQQLKLGDSISVDGVCLTVTKFSNTKFNVDVMPETYKATTLSFLDVNKLVNLERSLLFGGRVSGHFVTGHVDGIGLIINKYHSENAVNYTIKVNSELLKYVTIKGSIAVDGISLTIFGVDYNEQLIKIALIPHTVTHTTLGYKNIGDKVNIENDILGKYIIDRPNNSLYNGR
jgi:riboflavin synthase